MEQLAYLCAEGLFSADGQQGSICDAHRTRLVRLQRDITDAAAREHAKGVDTTCSSTTQERSELGALVADFRWSLYQQFLELASPQQRDLVKKHVPLHSVEVGNVHEGMRMAMRVLNYGQQWGKGSEMYRCLVPPQSLQEWRVFLGAGLVKDSSGFCNGPRVNSRIGLLCICCVGLQT